MIGASKDWRRDPGERPLPLALPPERADGGRILILLAEDNFLIADAMRLSLADAGHRILLAREARQALAAAAERPDVAIVDLALGDGLSGPELARALAATGARIVVCSGFPAERAAELLQGVPVAATLAKPVLWDELRRVLARVERELDAAPP